MKNKNTNKVLGKLELYGGTLKVVQDVDGYSSLVIEVNTADSKTKISFNEFNEEDAKNAVEMFSKVAKKLTDE